MFMSNNYFCLTIDTIILFSTGGINDAAADSVTQASLLLQLPPAHNSMPPLLSSVLPLISFPVSTWMALSSPLLCLSPNVMLRLQGTVRVCNNLFCTVP